MYGVHDTNPQVNPEPLERCKGAYEPFSPDVVGPSHTDPAAAGALPQEPISVAHVLNY